MAILNSVSGVTSNTTIVNGTAYTQNIINLGGNNSSCSGGTNYCQEGYSVYVPCLKSITRGQNVCFQFYIADKGSQDTLDLNDLCGLTFSLSGPFGCSYGDYTYPNDIKSLQGEDLAELKCETFDGNIYRFDVGYIEYDVENKKITEFDIEDVNKSNDGLNVNVVGVYGDFYKGEVPFVKAEDSPTHIFVGWTTDERLSELCENFNIDDVIVSYENEWIWESPIDRDITIYAVYRKRKKYRVMLSFDNRHSYFLISYNNDITMLSDKERDYVEILEGYRFIAKCCPISSYNRQDKITYSYRFYKWSDGYLEQIREYVATDDLFVNGVLRLIAICSNDKVASDVAYNDNTDITNVENIFVINLPKYHPLSNGIYTYTPNDNIIGFTGVEQIYNSNNNMYHSYITLNKDGYLLFDSECNEGDDIKVVIELADKIGCKTEGEIFVKNGEQITSVYSNDRYTTEFEFDFRNCESNIFEITTTFENICIHKICVYEKIITNKGLVELCIPKEDTVKFYRGILNMSGAICVNDNWYGLDTVQIGVVNNITPISIIE